MNVSISRNVAAVQALLEGLVTCCSKARQLLGATWLVTCCLPLASRFELEGLVTYCRFELEGRITCWARGWQKWSTLEARLNVSISGNVAAKQGSHSHSLTLTHSLSLSPTHTHSLSHTHTLSLSHTHTTGHEAHRLWRYVPLGARRISGVRRSRPHPLSLSLSHTHTHTHSGVQ